MDEHAAVTPPMRIKRLAAELRMRRLDVLAQRPTTGDLFGDGDLIV